MLGCALDEKPTYKKKKKRRMYYKAAAWCWDPFYDLEDSKSITRSAWVAQSVEPLTSAPVMISRSRSSSPASGSVLMARSLEPASGSVSPSVSAPPPLVLCLSLSLKKK